MHTSRALAEAPEVPDFGAYKHSSASNNRALSYFLIGSMGVVSASLAKSTVTGFLSSMAASADVLALAKVEVEMANIPEGMQHRDRLLSVASPDNLYLHIRQERHY